MKNVNKKGFTLIELMVVVSIIGVLASIAVIQFMSSYRTRSYNTSAKADLRAVATAQEAYFVDAASYTNSMTNLMNTSYGVGLSEGVVIPILSADSSGYTMQSYHTAGNVTYVMSGPGGHISP